MMRPASGRGGHVRSSRSQGAALDPIGNSRPVLICLFGAFRLLRFGERVLMRGGGKTEKLLCYLALRVDQPVARETLIEAVWPESETNLGAQALNSLVHSLRRTFASGPDKQELIVHEGGAYQLNVGPEVGLDLAAFESLAAAGDQQARQSDDDRAMESYTEAVQLYRGDLCAGDDLRAAIERERLRSRYLSLLAHLAGYYFNAGSYAPALAFAQRLLGADPCREDAHRVVMRCHVRLGERSQALRQYRLCEQVLRREFDAPPEPATLELFDQIRLSPHSI